MTKLEIAKAIRDNRYSCGGIGLICSKCPINVDDGCGNSDPLGVAHSKRIQLIDDYITKHDKENIMTELQALEKAIEENRKAGEELQRMFEEYKSKKENIVFDDNVNWGVIAAFGRSILSVNGSENNFVEWKTFSTCTGGAIGVFNSGQEAIDSAIARGWKVIKLARGPKAVAKFLLGED